VGRSYGQTTAVGVYAYQRLNLAKLGRPMVTGQGFKPDPRNSAVRDYRGASGNVVDGGIVNPPRNRKGRDGNPPPNDRRARALSQPSNVAQAINFYQCNGLLHGRPSIHAVDPANTRILGNLRLDYSGRHIDCRGFPWFARTFMLPHIEIENDPYVWGQIRALIDATVRGTQLTAHGGRNPRP
jgi:hypothetical protein